MSPSRTRGGIRNAAGGWPKSVDFAAAPTPQSLADAVSGGRANSLDSDATTVPMQFLARVAQATGDEQYRRSFVRGLDYLMEAQYPNGGWPQFFPLREGYYSHITFNDGAMIHALTLLRDGDWAESLLSNEYPRWAEKHGVVTPRPPAGPAPASD